jgi:hypothetical protein
MTLTEESMLFTYVAAARACCAPSQLSLLREEVVPLVTTALVSNDPAPVKKAVQHILGVGWQPRAEWAALLAGGLVDRVVA